MIETRNEVLMLPSILDRIEAFCSQISQSDHKFVGIESSDPITFLIGLYACSKIGRICVPLDQMDAVQYRFICDSLELDIVVIGGNASRQPRDAEKQKAVIESFDPDVMARTAVLLFTAGTTSASSKGVFMAGSAISFVCQRMNESMSIDHTAREYILARIDHAFGFGRCHSLLTAGGTVVLPNRLNTRELVAQFGRRKCNGLAAVASLLTIVLDQFETLGEGPFALLRYVQIGGMRFAQKYRRIMKANAGVSTFINYGLTEAMRATFLDLNSFPDKLHTEGKPFNGVQVAISDTEGRHLEPLQSGEICIRGESLALGYTDRRRWARVTQDGWFHTGDIGHLDEDGFLIYEGRSADAMNISGTLLYPDDIEERLRPLFGAAPFSVFGVADKRGIKDDLMYIAYEGPEGMVTNADCVRYLRQLGFESLPEGIIAVDALPRNKQGKVQRYALQRLIA